MDILPTSSFLTSKVARRIFVLFVLCALVPIAGLALYSFGRVSAQLRTQGEERLETAVRDLGQGIAQRLQLLDTELRLAAARPGAAGSTPSNLDDPTARRLLGAAIIDASGGVTALFGDIDGVSRPDAEQHAHLETGRTLLTGVPHRAAPPELFLTRAADPAQPAGALYVGKINPVYLWTGAADSLGHQQLCVFDDDNRVLFCTAPADGQVPAAVTGAVASAAYGSLAWDIDGEEHQASFWSIPLMYQFRVQWTLMLSEPTAAMLAPMAGFRYFFSLVILISLWVVLLLSIGQIRRSLVPLERLQVGTRLLAQRQFDNRVEVDSNDEFEELADSFNDMAERLGKQFTALAAIAEIDRTILSSLNIEEIVETVLRGMSDLVAADSTAVTLISPDQQKVPRSYLLESGDEHVPTIETTFFEQADFQRFSQHPNYSVIASGAAIPRFLSPMARQGCKHFVVLPMFINGEASGVIALGFRSDEPVYSEEDLEQVRQLTDQVAVALANTHLVEDLDALNWGTLTALARTVDAKSPWTAGHSERVTSLGIRIGDELKLTPGEIDILHRGGLLHDIGKIGVPAAILDKPGKLTDEEFDLMKQHPAIGANILQPIAAYADVLPIVRQHHERWDGNGYPDGLSHKQIHFFARIFAVADVYDALISDRPYRDGYSQDAVIGIITEASGSHFDPEVVDAFLRIMKQEVGMHALESA